MRHFTRCWLVLFSLTAAVAAAGDECAAVQTLRTGGPESGSSTFTVGSAAVAASAASAPSTNQGPPAGVDFAAVRAYLRTEPNGGGIEVAQPALGQRVYFYADYTVSGGSGPINVLRRATLNNAPVCDSGSYQSAGSYTVHCVDSWVATTGPHTLRWALDYNGSVTETDENNNVALKTISPTGVDIVAQRAFLRTAPANGGSEVAVPEVGQTVYFHVAFAVQGTGGPITVPMRLLLNGSLRCSCEMTGIPGNTYVAWCPAGWTVTQRSHTMQWGFDASNAVEEANESNNNVQVQFTPTGGDFTGPTGSALLNEGDPYTGSTRVRLALSASDAGSGVAGLWVSFSPATPTAGQSGWTSMSPVPTFQNTISAHLPAGYGEKTVYVWYKDAMENVSARYSDSIFLGPPVRNDVDGDGRADLLWRNTSTQQTALWFMNGTAAPETAAAHVVHPDWNPAVAGDWEADGRADFFWHKPSTGATSVWLQWSGTEFTLRVAGPPVPVGWVPVAAGHLDSDGKSDIFWYNPTTGETSIWFFSGTWYLSAIRSTSVPPSWVPSVSGDFDADGLMDLFWHNPPTGETALWMAWNGTSFAVQVRMDTVPPNWVPEGAGDVSGDGRGDILWRNTSTGETVLWVMNGAATPASVALTTVPTSWIPAAFGDYDGDARTDVLWRNPSTGETSLWLGFNGTAFTTQVRWTTVPVEWVPFHSR
jgi:hypothetical protein